MKTQNSIKSRETFVEASSIAAIAISVIALLITLTSSAAEFKFASVCSDDMVIQRDVASPVWGFAEPGAKVSVALNGKTVGEATADEKGRWTVKLPPQKANKKPSTITAKCGKETHSITNVLFGDVWFGCGQSNMAYTFAGYGRLPIGGEEFLKKAEGNPNIRTLLMNDGENKNSPYPREDAIGIKWETSTYKSMRKNGAALYWMGWKLNKVLDVPIGLVNASWGATKIDGWIDQAWAKDHGTGHAKGVAGFWYNRWTDFMKAGGPEVYEKKIFEWNKRFDPASNFVNTKPSLHDPDFVEDESWKELTIDGRGFQCDPFPEGFTGEVWMRATFELTEADLKKNWSIGYSESYGQDMNYLNGHAFGGSGNPNHGYGVPIKEHGRVGKNVLSVRYKVYAASKEGRPGGMLKPVSIALWLESPRVPQAERCARNQLVQRDDHGRGARPSALPDGDQGRGLVPGLQRPRERQVRRLLQDSCRGMARAVHLQGQTPRDHHRNLPAPARHQAELHAAHGERRDERPDVVGERRHAPPAQ